MEGLFKFVFFLAVIVFCIVIVALFLTLLKVLLIFYPDLHIMGMVIANY